MVEFPTYAGDPAHPGCDVRLAGEPRRDPLGGDGVTRGAGRAIGAQRGSESRCATAHGGEPAVQ